MASKILPFLDAIVTTLETTFTDESIPVTVSRAYDFVHDMGRYTGLKVDVYVDKDLIHTEATRAEDYYDTDFNIVVSERYTTPEVIPLVWIDERVSWVENLVFDVLYPANRPLILTVGSDQYWCQYVNRTVIADMGYLQEHKVFWSELEGSFRRLRS